MQFDAIRQSLTRVLDRADASGVVTLDSGRPGPAMAVCALTHGNEISGIVTADRLLRGLDAGQWQLERGSLRVLLANYPILHGAGGFEELTRHRGIDLNRIWSADLAAVARGETGEHEFAVRERLLPALASVDGLIDLHSTSLESTPIGIAMASQSTLGDISQVLDVPFLMPDIGEHLNGTAMIERHHQIRQERQSSPDEAHHFSLVIEAGQHFDFSTIDRNLENVVALLQMSGVLAGSPRPLDQPAIHLHTYHVGLSEGAGDIIEWCYTDKPGGFDRVDDGTLVCKLHGKPVVARGETYIVMPQLLARNAGQEMFYLATPF